MAANCPRRIGFIGGGEMASNLARGFIDSEFIPAANIIASARTEKTLEKWKEMGCQTTLNNLDVVNNSTFVFVAVKPSMVLDILSEIAGSLKEHHLVISVAAGVLTKDMETVVQQKASHELRDCACDAKFWCCNKTMFCNFCCGRYATPKDAEFVVQLMSSVGIITEIEENQMNAVTSLSGSGIAFMYLVLEAMIDGGVKVGLPRRVSSELAVNTMKSAAMMVQATGEGPGQLKEGVCSPGGTTIAGIHQLEVDGLRAALMNAVEVGANRAKEMGEKK